MLLIDVETDVKDRHARRYHLDTQEVHMCLQQWLNDTARMRLGIYWDADTVIVCIRYRPPPL